eukprot:1508576-Pleurochrysis_carterae.AAC.3
MGLPPALVSCALVSAGACGGAVSRFGISEFAKHRGYGAEAICAINIVGSLALGVLAGTQPATNRYHEASSARQIRSSRSPSTLQQFLVCCSRGYRNAARFKTIRFPSVFDIKKVALMSDALQVKLDEGEACVSKFFLHPFDHNVAAMWAVARLNLILN